MELELKRIGLNTYQNTGEIVLTQEETAETIVPDYCPDIARIVKTDNKIFLHHREVRDGKAEIAGNLRMNVLYVADGDHGVRVLEFVIPFSVESDHPMFSECQNIICETENDFLETRMLNPRKLFTRCKFILRVTGYRSGPLQFSSDVEETERFFVEKRREQHTAILVTQISEKDFTFAGTVNLSSGKSGAAEILGSQVSWDITETKIVGQKLIFKGIIFVCVLYRSVNGECCSVTAELPFSQIMELEAAAESAEVSLNLHLTGTDIQIDGEDPEGRQLSVMLYFHGVALLREKQDLVLLNDLYSTAYELDFDVNPLKIVESREIFNRKQTVRELLEIGSTAECMLTATVKCGNVMISQEEGKTILRTVAEIKVLYLGEGGVPLLAERNVNVVAPIDVPVDCAVKARAVCAEEVQGSLSERGIEVRVPIDFRVEIEKHGRRVCVNRANIDLEAEKDLAGMPSLVLRSVEANESAWDLAKKYNSTIADILTANQLEREPLPAETLLLIPRKKM